MRNVKEVSSVYRSVRGLWLLGAAVLSAAAAVSAQASDIPAGRAIKLAPAFTRQQLTALPTDAWITNGGNIFNQRYSPLTEINKDNVKNLKAEWRIHLGSGVGPQYSGQAQPLFYDGVLYYVTGANDAFAIDVETGKILWTYKANLDPARVKVCCGWVARGVGLGEGKVFVGQLDAKLVALDQKTGKVVWAIQGEDPLQGYSIVSAPLYYDGMVITGYAGGDMGIRGRVKAYSAKNGKLLWTFYTIPAPGEFGSETWQSDNDYYKYGGAPVWQTPAVDPDLGLLYFSTGNAGPDYAGWERGGDNLFTASIVAIEAKTGKYRWHFQQVHHDIWDYDSPNPVVLFDAPYEGRMRKGIAQISKTAWVYILDRETGKPLIGIEEKPVPQEPRQKTAATQPYPIGDPLIPQYVDIAPEGFDLVNGGKIFTPFWDKPIVYRPQMAVNWPPSSYDPTTNHFFVCGIDNLAVSATDPRPLEKPRFEGMWMGTGPLPFPQVARRGVFGAYDLKTNRLVWEQAWPEGCMSGSINTAGGLIFVGRSDGRFLALDKTNGHKLWEFLTDAGVNATASTFEYKGRQYVAVLSAGTLFGTGKRGDSVWLFSLAGKIESIPINAPAPRIPGQTPPPAPDLVMPAGEPNVAHGKDLYGRFCVACHGEEGMGGHGGGAALSTAAKDMSVIFTTASTGKNQGMPSFKGALTAEELRDIAGYIAKELRPGQR
ncbi:MAG TPA: PQQ-binding-like beta-propeller repeat protein [Gammaproteobacteria bacterium]|nr:PQQ-binding-like beta-propeller repeat protein [Gammaproteobacteria bacterium]